MSRLVRLVLVEDNAVYRSSLELLLAIQPGLEVVGTAETASEALAAVHELAPDVVLLDFRLPDMDGATATREFRARHPGVAVICLTAEASPEEWDAVIAAGAVSMIEKGVSIDELAGAILAAAG